MKGGLKKLYIAAFCIYMAAVALLCFMNPSQLPEMEVKTFLGLPIDKVFHFLMFLPYPILSSLSFITRGTGTSKNMTILIVLIILGIGISYGTEVIQAHTGYRSYDLGDFYADMTGIAAGTIFTVVYIAYTKLKK